MYRWIFAVVFAAALVGLLVLVTQVELARRPLSQAELEEARIFNADNAEWFGEDPEVGVSVALLALGEDGEGGIATLEVNGRPETARVGETLLPPCVSVAAMLEDGVLLDLCGGYDLLKLSIGAKVLTLPSDLAAPDRVRPPSIVDLRDNASLRALVRDYRSRLFNKPLSLIGQIEVDIKQGENGQRRFFVFPGKDRRLFSELPLQAGDQVLAVNGTPLSARESISDIYQNLDDAQQLTVTLVRNQQDLVLLLAF